METTPSEIDKPIWNPSPENSTTKQSQITNQIVLNPRKKTFKNTNRRTRSRNNRSLCYIKTKTVCSIGNFNKLRKNTMRVISIVVVTNIVWAAEQNFSGLGFAEKVRLLVKHFFSIYFLLSIKKKIVDTSSFIHLTFRVLIIIMGWLALLLKGSWIIILSETICYRDFSVIKHGSH